MMKLGEEEILEMLDSCSFHKLVSCFVLPKTSKMRICRTVLPAVSYGSEI